MAQNGADVNMRDNAGQTPLHQIAYRPVGIIEIAQGLVQAGADPNIKDNEGRTVLDLLRSSWRSGETLEAIKFLEELP